MAPPIDPVIASWQKNEDEIGMIRFFPTDAVADHFPFYELPENATFLGLLEVDAFCLMEDGTVRAYDHEVKGRVLCEAASDQASLVAALKVMEEHFDKCVEDDAYYDDEEAALAVAQRCGELAGGGEDYVSFFQMMVGV